MRTHGAHNDGLLMPDEELAVATLGRHFALLNALLSTAGDPAVDLSRVVDLAGRVMSHADACGITYLRHGQRPSLLASSNSLARHVDRIQVETGEGPCLDAARSDVVEMVGDLSTEARWPLFGPRCSVETGVLITPSVRLPLGSSDQAAINFHSQNRHAFDDADIPIASMFAPFAALAIESSQRKRDESDFQIALSTSRQIGTAIGILMARNLVTSHEAFEQLRSASQQLNIKLRDLAAQVEMTGELGGLPARSAGHTGPDGESDG